MTFQLSSAAQLLLLYECVCFAAFLKKKNKLENKPVGFRPDFSQDAWDLFIYMLRVPSRCSSTLWLGSFSSPINPSLKLYRFIASVLTSGSTPRLIDRKPRFFLSEWEATLSEMCKQSRLISSLFTTSKQRNDATPKRLSEVIHHLQPNLIVCCQHSGESYPVFPLTPCRFFRFRCQESKPIRNDYCEINHMDH